VIQGINLAPSPLSKLGVAGKGDQCDLDEIGCRANRPAQCREVTPLVFARKLAVMMRSMLKTGELFKRSIEVAA